MNFCTNCGNKREKDDKFCGICGKKFPQMDGEQPISQNNEVEDPNYDMEKKVSSTVSAIYNSLDWLTPLLNILLFILMFYLQRYLNLYFDYTQEMDYTEWGLYSKVIILVVSLFIVFIINKMKFSYSIWLPGVLSILCLINTFELIRYYQGLTDFWKESVIGTPAIIASYCYLIAYILFIIEILFLNSRYRKIKNNARA